MADNLFTRFVAAVPDPGKAFLRPPGAPAIAYAEAFFALQEGLEALFQRKVDLVSAKSIINPYFAQSVAASARKAVQSPRPPRRHASCPSTMNANTSSTSSQ